MNDFGFLTDLYEELYLWLSSNSPGEYVTKGYFKSKDKKVWDKIINKIKELESKSYLNDVEKDFLNCKYVGKSYRVIRYNERRKGHIYLLDCYQSCSKTISGIDNVKLHGDVILIELFSSKQSYSIDLFKILEFMIKHRLILYKDEFDINHRDVLSLENYYDEEEVLVKINEENIRNVYIYNSQSKICKELDRNKWFRSNMQ